MTHAIRPMNPHLKEPMFAVAAALLRLAMLSA
jgi:hypothetical protein